jgi:UDP-GlcNAc:undecaprenyl-phosphate/decaprenyl-phosphate GlcNAc-1-phosphate transferase
VISGGIALLIRFFSPANAIGLTALWMLFLFLFGIHLFHTEPKVEESEDVQFAFVKRLKHRDTLALLVDFVFLAFAYYAAFIIAFKGNVPSSDLRLFVHSLPLVLGAKFAMLWVVGTYASSWWRGSRKDLYRVVQGIAVGEVIAILLLVLLYRFEGFSRLVFALDALLSAFFLVSFRRSFYVFRDLVHSFREPRPGRARVLIVGTWHGADLACRFLAEQNVDCVGLVDLNGGMDTGRVVWGLPVLGRVADIPFIASHNFLDAVVLAEPVDPSAVLTESCRRSNLPLYLFGLRENSAAGLQTRPELVWRNPMRTGRAAGD